MVRRRAVFRALWGIVESSVEDALVAPCKPPSIRLAMLVVWSPCIWAILAKAQFEASQLQRWVRPILAGHCRADRLEIGGNIMYCS